jgi:mannose-1-phosphate guanylyltransferase
VLVGAYPWNHSTFDTLMPRALLPIAHRRLIDYAFDWLSQGGIRDVAVSGNRDSRGLHAALRRDEPAGMMLAYHEDSVPRGAAGSVRDAAYSVDADTFVVAEGTAIPQVDLADLLSKHHLSGATATVVVHREPAGTNGQDVHVPAGIYIFSRRALEFISAREFCDVKENLIPALYQAGHRVLAYTAASASARVLSPATYLAVNGWMVECLLSQAELPAEYTRVGSSLVHRHASVSAEARFVGAVMVGPKARIDSGVTIVGPTSIGPGTRVRTGSVVSRSAVWQRASLAEGVMVDRSIVADDVVLGPSSSVYKRILTPVHRRPDSAVRRGPESSGQWTAAGLRFWRRIGRLMDAGLSTASQ